MRIYKGRARIIDSRHERGGAASRTGEWPVCAVYLHATRGQWHGGVVRAKSLRPWLRACASFNRASPRTRTHTPCIAIACIHDACFASCAVRLRLSPSIWQRQRPLTLACWPWVSAALIRYVSARALPYPYSPGIRGSRRCSLDPRTIERHPSRAESVDD